jgi:membrane protein YqaA with SNARE-associated domain
VSAASDKALAAVNGPGGEAVAERAMVTLGATDAGLHPAPVEVVLVHATLLNPDRAFRYAMLATAGSVAGAALAYVVGYLLYLTLGVGVLSLYGVEEVYGRVAELYGSYAAVVLLASGFAPVPFAVFTFLHGLMQGNAVLLVGAVMLARGARYTAMAWLLWRGGVGMKAWIERRFNPLVVAATVLALIVFVSLKYVFSHIGG